MSKNLSWFEARDLARTGRAIRRDAWRRWITFGPALAFTERIDEDGDALRYVVLNEEFRAAEFLAHDWTDEPWPDGPPEPPPRPPRGGGGGFRSGGGSRRWGGPTNPPGPGSFFVLEPGGDGGGGGGNHPPHNPPVAQVPTVTVVLTTPDDLPACYDILDDEPATVRIHAQVSIAGGPPGVGTLSVEIGAEEQLGTGWPGMNKGYEFAAVTFALGGTITCDVTYIINAVTYTGSGDFAFPDACYPGP